MNASELRIGNLIQLFRKPTDGVMSFHAIRSIIYSDDDNGFMLELEDGFLVNADTGVKPISITEELLKEGGFDSKGFLETGSDQAIQIEGNKFYLFGPDSATSGQCYSSLIHYVHQLQNLHHTLTGKELTFNHKANG